VCGLMGELGDGGKSCTGGIQAGSRTWWIWIEIVLPREEGRSIARVVWANCLYRFACWVDQLIAWIFDDFGGTTPWARL